MGHVHVSCLGELALRLGTIGEAQVSEKGIIWHLSAVGINEVAHWGTPKTINYFASIEHDFFTFFHCAYWSVCYFWIQTCLRLQSTIS